VDVNLEAAEAGVEVVSWPKIIHQLLHLCDSTKTSGDPHNSDRTSRSSRQR
jgi:hypothetical protein